MGGKTEDGDGEKVTDGERSRRPGGHTWGDKWTMRLTAVMGSQHRAICRWTYEDGKQSGIRTSNDWPEKSESHNAGKKERDGLQAWLEGEHSKAAKQIHRQSRGQRQSEEDKMEAEVLHGGRRGKKGGLK